MSERSVLTPSGMLSRGLAFAARHSPKGLNLILAAGYGICEILGAGVLLSTLWPFLQSTLREKLSVANTTGDKQGAQAGKPKITDSNLP